MFNDNGHKGSACKYCLKIWDRQGKPYAQSHDITPWVEDGYKVFVCENCLSNRASEAYALRKPGKKLLDREYQKGVALTRRGTEPRVVKDFDFSGIM